MLANGRSCPHRLRLHRLSCDLFLDDIWDPALLWLGPLPGVHRHVHFPGKDCGVPVSAGNKDVVYQACIRRTHRCASRASIAILVSISTRRM